jgi:hypothetical protein
MYWRTALAAVGHQHRILPLFQILIGQQVFHPAFGGLSSQCDTGLGCPAQDHHRRD